MHKEFKGQESNNILGFSPLKIGPIGCPESRQGIRYYPLRNSPEERSPQQTIYLQNVLQ